MENWHKGIVVNIENDKPKEDEELRFESSYYEGTKSGWHENKIEMVRKKDGAIFLSGEGDGAFVYLYPEQIKHLKKLIRAL